jgi:hypothetical protein
MGDAGEHRGRRDEPVPERGASGDAVNAGPLAPARGAGAEDEAARALTGTGPIPLILPDLPADAAGALVAQLADPRTFRLPFPAPATARTEPTFAPELRTGPIRRGPSWVSASWLPIDSSCLHGLGNLASELAERTPAMVARGGMRACSNPHTAEGYGARRFGWTTTLVLDNLAAPDDGRAEEPVPPPRRRREDVMERPASSHSASQNSARFDRNGRPV